MDIQGYMSIQECIDYMANASMAFSHGVYTHNGVAESAESSKICQVQNIEQESVQGPLKRNREFVLIIAGEGRVKVLKNITGRPKVRTVLRWYLGIFFFTTFTHTRMTKVFKSLSLIKWHRRFTFNSSLYGNFKK